jgi:hypothetical protein
LKSILNVFGKKFRLSTFSYAWPDPDRHALKFCPLFVMQDFFIARFITNLKITACLHPHAK